MQIDIQTADNINLNEHLTEVINRKVEKLEHFYNQIMDCIVYLKDNGVNSKEVELKVLVKDDTLFCSEKADSLEKAVDAAVEAMRKQVQKYKEKHQGK